MRLWLTLTVLFMAVVSFQSCVYDHYDENCHAGDDGKLYISVSFNCLPSDGGRAATRTFEPTEDDEDYERKISDVRLFLVSRNNPSEPVYEIKNFKFDSSVSMTTDPFPIESKYRHGYLLYVLANTSGTGVFEPNLASGTDFVGEYSLGTEARCSKMWQKNNFVMVNVRNNLADHDGDTPVGGVPIEIDDNNSYSYENPYKATVTLERLAAKIVVDCSEEYFDFDKYTGGFEGGFTDVSIDGVALVNCVNRFNLIQRWQKAINKLLSWNKIVDDDNYDGEPPYGYPYLWCQTPSGTLDYDMSEGYYNRIYDFADPDTQSMKSGASDMFVSPDYSDFENPGVLTFYSLENNSPLYACYMKRYNSETGDFKYGSDDELFLVKTKMKGRTTGVLFRVRARLEVDSHSGEDIKKDPENGKWDTRSTYESDYKTFYCYKKTVYPSVKSMLNDNNELSGLTESSSVRDLRKRGVRVYENGYMYYIHWIIDKNYKYVWDLFGDEYGEGQEYSYPSILRNTCYEVNVEKVEVIGMDLPGHDVDINGVVLERNDYLHSPLVWSRSAYENEGVGDTEFDQSILENLR